MQLDQLGTSRSTACVSATSTRHRWGSFPRPPASKRAVGAIVQGRRSMNSTPRHQLYAGGETTGAHRGSPRTVTGCVFLQVAVAGRKRKDREEAQAAPPPPVKRFFEFRRGFWGRGFFAEAGPHVARTPENHPPGAGSWELGSTLRCISEARSCPARVQQERLYTCTIECNSKRWRADRGLRAGWWGVLLRAWKSFDWRTRVDRPFEFRSTQQERQGRDVVDDRCCAPHPAIVKEQSHGRMRTTAQPNRTGVSARTDPLGVHCGSGRLQWPGATGVRTVHTTEAGFRPFSV